MDIESKTKVLNKINKIGIMILIVLCIAIVVLFIYACLMPNRNNQDQLTPEQHAYYTAEQFVAQFLKAPSTADFAPFNNAYITDLGNYKYSVVINVDATNSFGVKLRSRFIVTLHYENDKWLLDNLKQIK